MSVNNSGSPGPTPTPTRSAASYVEEGDRYYREGRLDKAIAAYREALKLDPTNSQWVTPRYVTVAWGRDYADVPPLKGVIFTEAKRSTLRVAVDVAPLEGAVV